jgi:tetrahydromethanopterin S-methyltransferase subunit B
MSEIFDFGFTAVTEDELEKVQEITTQVQQTETSLTSLQGKVDDLYNAIIPLLTNLKKNPEKDYIHWPNRLDKVEQFETFLTEIYQR